MKKLSREELIEMICPTNATSDCVNCTEYCKVLNDLLDRYDKTIREETIYEVENALIGAQGLGRMGFEAVLKTLKQLKGENV